MQFVLASHLYTVDTCCWLYWCHHDGSGDWIMSPKDPKDEGTHLVCWSIFKIQRVSGNLHKCLNPCLGSNKPPIKAVKDPQRGKASSICKILQTSVIQERCQWLSILPQRATPTQLTDVSVKNVIVLTCDCIMPVLNALHWLPVNFRELLIRLLFLHTKLNWQDNLSIYQSAFNRNYARITSGNRNRHTV